MGNILGYGKRRESVAAALLIGCVVTVMTTLVGAAIVAKLIDAEMMEESAMGYAVPFLLIAASYLGCRIGSERFERNRIMICTLVAVIYMVLLIGANLLIFKGQFQGIGVTVLVIMCGMGLAALPKKEKRGGRRRRNYKIPTR